MPPTSPPHVLHPAVRYALLPAVALLAVVWFRLGSAPVFDLDEGLYATCARNMARSGDFVTPRLNSRPPADLTRTMTPFYEKPPMVYWTAALSIRAFGATPLAVRLPAALATTLTALLIGLWAAARYDARVGSITAALFAASPMTAVDGRMLTTDALLVLFVTAAMVAFWEALHSVGRRALLWAAAFWVSTGCAVLTKGAVALVLPAIIVAVFLVVRRRDEPAPWKALSRLQPLAGIVLAAVIAAPWHILAAHTGEREATGYTFVQEYFIRQHLGRFRGGDVVHNLPFFAYALFFLAGFLPWSLAAPAAFRASGAGDARLRSYLLSWIGAVFVFYSLSAAKLPAYIAPLYPPAAILTAVWLSMRLRDPAGRAATATLAGGTVVAGLVLAALYLAPGHVPAGSPVPADALSAGRIAAAALFVPLLAGLLAAVVRRASAGVALYVAGIAAVGGFACVAATVGYAAVTHDVSGPFQRLATAASGDAARGIPVVYYHVIPRRPSMLFYAGYSPVELRDPPLAPLLFKLRAGGSTEADVITSGTTATGMVIPELTAAHLPATIRATDHGWVTLRASLGETAAHPHP